MTAIDLKNVLIHKIAAIDDISFLEAIKTILDSKTSKEILTLSDKQRDDIISSKKEIYNGLFIDQNDLDKEIKGWLNAK